MEVEVVAPLPTSEFNFDSSCSSPYITAPSSPQRSGGNLLLFTAPTSPSHNSYDDLKFNVAGSSPEVHFDWESKQRTPKRKGFDGRDQSNDDDFEFNFSGQLERPSLSADELFDGGKIKPLKPLPPVLEPAAENNRSPLQQQQRGRESRSPSSPPSSYNYSYIYKKSRSLSSSSSLHSQCENPAVFSTNRNPKSYVSSLFSAISFQKGNKKWKLKDFLLFRSASEGRATSIKEPFRKYSVLGKKEAAEDVKNASFRSSESGASSKRRAQPVSAHELHYTAKRAETEEMRRKTFLPYKQGLLGCLGFNPGMHEISRGVGSLTRG
ncbi:hypothetical protein like AT2G15760 [Hibiscus trionum]|uniref:Calmodulin-binding protein n=1 Tax=Hibiscus trionum TaxID=183268 RepID=A0A9W7MN67_HIBTR|nr:hypothetical protein like AT2G15760 [Hibiscus trionum]